MATTTKKDIAVDDGVLDTVHEHVDPYLEQEVGGFLVGTLVDGQVTIRHALPALEAVGHRAQLTFTHSVWEEMLARVDRDFPDLRIVGWYHSHPGFGIFLSEYDKFIQRNFFSAPGMVALVVDPHSGEHGWFGWKNGDGEESEIVLLDDGSSAARREPRAPVTPSSSGGGSNLGTRILVGAVIAIAGFAIGLAVGGSGDTTPEEPPAVTQTDPVTDPTPDVPEPDRDGGLVAEPTGRVVIDYRVRRGDSLWTLAESFYGSGFSYQELTAVNPDVDADALEVGDVLRIPVEGEPEVER